jgi:hypothetical protein
MINFIEFINNGGKILSLDNENVKIYTTSAEGKFPIHGAVGNNVVAWDEAGNAFGVVGSDLSLRRIDEKTWEYNKQFQNNNHEFGIILKETEDRLDEIFVNAAYESASIYEDYISLYIDGSGGMMTVEEIKIFIKNLEKIVNFIEEIGN